MYTDPFVTLRLLRELERAGFDDKAFAIIHFKDKTIEPHRKHCAKGGTLKGDNTIVQRRLERLLELYKKDKKPFEVLAKQVAEQIPFTAK